MTIKVPRLKDEALVLNHIFNNKNLYFDTDDVVHFEADFNWKQHLGFIKFISHDLDEIFFIRRNLIPFHCSYILREVSRLRILEQKISKVREYRLDVHIIANKICYSAIKNFEKQNINFIYMDLVPSK